MRRHPLAAASILLATLLTACGGTSPSGDPASAPAALKTPGAPGSTAGSTGDGSLGLITSAYEAGRIDRATAILYRLQAAFGDDRLPAEFRAGPIEEDGAAATIAAAEWDTFTEEQQAALLPYLVRPTQAQSIWSSATARAGGGGASTGVGTVTLAAAAVPIGPVVPAIEAPAAAAACQGGFMRRSLADLPVVIWGQCGFDDAAIAAKMADTEAVLKQVWGPMTDLMGWPLGDQNVPGDAYPDTPEAGDGLLDIYVIAAPMSAHGRALQSDDALAVTLDAAPFEGRAGAQRSSSFIVIDGTGAGGTKFKSTIVHEFFHSLQNAHNNTGMLVPSGTGAAAAWEYHWFVEASAAWADHHWVPEARALKAYPRVDAFQATGRSMTSVAGANEYESWVWAYFVEQEQDEFAIGQMWGDFEDKNGFDALQQAMDGVFSFKDRFRDFAVRAFNTDLQPGRPISPMFQALDASFPTTAPNGARRAAAAPVPVGPELSTQATLPGLWSLYYELDPEPDAKKVEFDFSGMTPAGMLDVDLLIKTKDGWIRRPSSGEPVCNAEKIIVVMANHDIARGAQVTGTWKVKAADEPCNDGNWSITLTGAKAGAGTYSGRVDWVYCSLMDGDWTVRFQTDMTGDIYSASARTGPQAISVNTRFAMDDPGDWDWQATFPGSGSVSITGDTTQELWRVHVEASWDDSRGQGDPIPLSVTIDVTCNDTFKAP